MFLKQDKSFSVLLRFILEISAAELKWLTEILLVVISKHSTSTLPDVFAFNHDVTGSSLSSSCLCRAYHYTGRWVDWIPQPAIKNFIVASLAQFFCPLKAIIQGCSHSTTLHRICFLAVRAENSK